MRVITGQGDQYRLDCNRDELMILSNSINNLAQSVDAVDHTTLIGATTDEIGAVHAALLDTIRAGDRGSAIRKLTLSHYAATRSARVLWAMHEVADCKIVVEPVDLYRGAQYRPDYLARNPNHNVPVLEVTWADGSVQTMLESAAMVTFLGDAYPGAGLAPSPAATRARADYLQMIQFGGSPMDMMLWQVRIHEHVLPEEERDPLTVTRYRSKFVNEVEPQLAARLSAQAFICGDNFTLADCMIGHNVTWARGYGMCQDDVFRDYLSRLSKRPAFQAAFADAKNFNPVPPKREGGPPSPFSG